MKADDSKMVSTGDHVPVCFVNELRAKGVPLKRSGIHENSLSFRVFDELFMNNLVGSKWMPIDALESFYSEKGLDGLTATIRVHAQEVIIASEEEMEKRKGKG
jgi:hypothetical protein